MPLVCTLLIDLQNSPKNGALVGGALENFNLVLAGFKEALRPFSVEEGKRPPPPRQDSASGLY